MIFVTLGTQKFQMNRLLEHLDKIADSLGEEIFIQKGASTYIPQKCKYIDFLKPEEFEKKMEECSVLLTHSGVGSIMTGIRRKKPVIVVPRLAKYGEHVDDHQVQIAEVFEEKNLVLRCDDCEDIPKLVVEAKKHKFDEYVMKGGKIEDIILDYLKLK